MTDDETPRSIPYADQCERCWRYNNVPTARWQRGNEMSCIYHCRCGYEWTCNWSVGAVEGWEAA